MTDSTIPLTVLSLTPLPGFRRHDRPLGRRRKASGRPSGGNLAVRVAARHRKLEHNQSARCVKSLEKQPFELPALSQTLWRKRYLNNVSVISAPLDPRAADAKEPI